MGTRHPTDALFRETRPFPVIPACDHYAGTEARMRKALALQAERGPVFDVTLDLEDGAPTGQEGPQAELVVELLRGELNAHGRVGARIHDHDSAWWQRDVDTLIAGAGARLAHLTIPKVASARQLAEMITYVQQVASRHGVGGEIPIHVLIETHGAVLEAQQLAAMPWVRSLDFGIMDFVSAHHGAIGSEAMRSPGQFEHALVARAKTMQVAAALGHGLVPTHGVTLDFRDVSQCAADARRARREFGYLRMWSIHPSQIDPILEAFAPDASEVELGAQVLLAAQREDWAPVSLADRLYDRASYRYYWTILRRAHQSGRAVPDEARAAFFDA